MEPESPPTLAMRWQHTRSRIGRVQFKDRYKGVTDIGHATPDVFAAWDVVSNLLYNNQVSGLCIFGTLHDGSTFSTFGRGAANINEMIGSSCIMTQRLLEYSKGCVDDFGKSG